MSDLIGFEGHLNETAPFQQQGYKVEYKSNTTYLDFSFNNEYKEECEYPRFWNESGQRVLATEDKNFSRLTGCFDSEFDQVSGPDSLLEELPRTDQI
jgi:alpha-1,3-glucan synthase